MVWNGCVPGFREGSGVDVGDATCTRRQNPLHQHIQLLDVFGISFFPRTCFSSFFRPSPSFNSTKTASFFSAMAVPSHALSFFFRCLVVQLLGFFRPEAPKHGAAPFWSPRFRGSVSGRFWVGDERSARRGRGDAGLRHPRRGSGSSGGVSSMSAARLCLFFWWRLEAGKPGFISFLINNNNHNNYFVVWQSFSR